MNSTPDRIRQTVSALTRILIAPASNLKVAILLYATIGVLLLIILVIGVMVIMAAPEDEETANTSPESRKDVPVRPRAANPMNRKMRLILSLGIVALLAGVWLVAGFTTSDSANCKGCHWSTSQHAKAEKAMDPHAGVNCVSCHEPGGVIGRFVTGVPIRVLHLATTSAGTGGESDYGRVTSRACTSCHRSSLSGTATNVKRGLKISHAEPLAASASCIDCHAMRNGIVSTHNAGMKPCLRCHDGGKVSSACVTCHQGKVATAARVRTTSFRNAQIRDVSCGGCHNEKQDCDPCHGARMPHTTEFMTGAHARAAAVDFWYNGGKACARCHTATRHPCGSCHTQLLGKAHGPSMSVGHKKATTSHCNSCHLQYATYTTRDFCKDICHSKAAEAATSPR